MVSWHINSDEDGLSVENLSGTFWAAAMRAGSPNRSDRSGTEEYLMVKVGIFSL